MLSPSAFWKQEVVSIFQLLNFQLRLAQDLTFLPCGLKLGSFFHLRTPHTRPVNRGSSYCLHTLQMTRRDQATPESCQPLWLLPLRPPLQAAHYSFSLHGFGAWILGLRCRQESPLAESPWSLTPELPGQRSQGPVLWLGDERCRSETGRAWPGSGDRRRKSNSISREPWVWEGPWPSPVGWTMSTSRAVSHREQGKPRAAASLPRCGS